MDEGDISGRSTKMGLTVEKDARLAALQVPRPWVECRPAVAEISPRGKGPRSAPQGRWTGRRAVGKAPNCDRLRPPTRAMRCLHVQPPRLMTTSGGPWQVARRSATAFLGGWTQYRRRGPYRDGASSRISQGAGRNGPSLDCWGDSPLRTCRAGLLLPDLTKPRRLAQVTKRRREGPVHGTTRRSGRLAYAARALAGDRPG